MNKIPFIAALLFFSLTKPILAGPADDAKNAGKAMGKEILNQLNTSEKLNDRFSEPLTSSGTPLKTFGDPAKQISFNGQISTQASSAFLEILIQPSATGDLTTAVIKQDLDMNGTSDYMFNVTNNISGVCANGYISCNAGTWDNCSYWNWKTNTSLEVYAASAADIASLAGCYCINNSCGSNLVWENITAILKDLGGAVVGAILDTNPQYTITNVSVSSTVIKYYGQLSTEIGNQTGTYFSGSPTPEDYYKPTNGSLPTDDLLLAQAGDPDSYYYQVNESLSAQNDPDNDYAADEGIAKAGAAQKSAKLTAGTVTYEDYNSDTGALTTRSFAFDSEPNPESCETACRVKASITDTEASNSGLTADYRTTVDSTTFYIRNCTAGTCPIKPGETIEKDCSCLNNFAESASLLQTLHEASKDVICSSRNLP